MRAFSGIVRGPLVALCVAALVGGCTTDDPKSASSGSAAPTEAPTTTGVPLTADETAEVVAALGEGETCAVLDSTHCLLPFPSDELTVEDGSTGTGRRAALPAALSNTSGVAVDMTEWNRNDGFSPGTPVLALLDDVDLAGSGAAPIGDIGRSLEEDSPTVVVDLTSGERLAHFAELDSTAPEGSRLTIVRSAAAYPEGHRIGVAFRSLQDAAGAPIDPSPAFRAFRDDIPTDLAAFEDRRPAMEELFAGLEEAGVEREALQLAWSFTVASQENLSERLLHIRDDAFGVLGEGAPTFRVDEVLESGLPEGIARRVKGAVDVPLYLTGSGEPGSRFEYGDDGLPATGGTMFPARYTCQIPRIALDGASGDTRAVVYGHGLLGSAGEAENSQVAKNASTNNMMYCAIDWIGMSASDLANALTILQDLSRFPTLVDRVQQGILNQQFLARAMKHPDGFASDPAFQDAAGASVLVPGEVYFDGNSQGSIIGGAATAISTEWDRAVLGVPGMNYSLLLPRSVDFDSYFAVMRVSYPDPVEHQLIYGVLQMLWDRAETNGYAQHLTSDPYEGTEAHQVALHVGFGDHQVSQYAAEFEARTIGAGLLSPALAAGRHPDAKPYYGLEEPDELPTGQSLLVYFDSGTLAPPSGPITPVESEEFIAECGGLTKDEKERSELCADSHEDPRRSPLAMAQKDAFFRPDGKLVDPCDAQPCLAENRFELDY